jgi:hypothetical protein
MDIYEKLIVVYIILIALLGLFNLGYWIYNKINKW